MHLRLEMISSEKEGWHHCLSQRTLQSPFLIFLLGHVGIAQRADCSLQRLELGVSCRVHLWKKLTNTPWSGGHTCRRIGFRLTPLH